MRRLRNKIVALLLTIVLAGIAGTVFFAAKIFLEDKRGYANELNTMAAPNLAAVIGKTAGEVRGELEAFDEALIRAGRKKATASAIRDAFAKMPFVLQVAVYSGKDLIVNASKSETPLFSPAAGASPKSDDVKFIPGKDKSKAVLISATINGRDYTAALDPAVFGEAFRLFNALPSAIVDQTGESLVINPARAPQLEEPEVKANISNLLGAREAGRVIAREMTLQNGRRFQTAVARVPGTVNASVVTQISDTQTSKMAAEVLRASLPFVAGVLLLTAAMGWVFSARLARPLEHLTQATSQVALGKWDVNLDDSSDDEIGRLVRAFREMGRELARREDELRKTQVNLIRSERLAVLGKFSAGIAHEIKNPLSAILTFSQLLQRRLAGAQNVDKDTGPFLSNIADETRRANKIISDLLTFARQKQPVLKAESVTEIMRHAADLFTATAAGQETQIVCEDKGYEDLKALMDRDQILQVLSNLVTNALQSLENHKGKRLVKLESSIEGTWAVIAVTDTGPGISKENLSKIFEPFFSTKQTGKGTGLGLSLCHGIVEQHGGRIEVSSDETATSFRVFLPT